MRQNGQHASSKQRATSRPFFHPEDGGNTFLRVLDELLQDHSASPLRELNFESSNVINISAFIFVYLLFIGRTFPDYKITDASSKQHNEPDLCMWNEKRMTHHEISRIDTGSELVKRVIPHCTGCNFVYCSSMTRKLRCMYRSCVVKGYLRNRTLKYT